MSWQPDMTALRWQHHIQGKKQIRGCLMLYKLRILHSGKKIWILCSSHMKFLSLFWHFRVSKWTILCRLPNFPFRKQAMPFSEHLVETFLIFNKFFSTKLKKKKNMCVTTWHRTWNFCFLTSLLYHDTTSRVSIGGGGGGPCDGWLLKISRFDGWRLNFRSFDGWRLIIRNNVYHTNLSTNLALSFNKTI